MKKEKYQNSERHKENTKKGVIRAREVLQEKTKQKKNEYYENPK